MAEWAIAGGLFYLGSCFLFSVWRMCRLIRQAEDFAKGEDNE